jgi:SAM-dependent methyltransferase
MSDTEAPYVQRMHSGAEYVNHITAQKSDRLVRAAFQDRVLKIAPPGGVLFDFGAGPGIDARYFAERGFKIAAYDVDPRMREFFGDYCRDLIDSGRVALHGSSYREFITDDTLGSVGYADLVIANFAPLNLVDDLGELFAKFRKLTAANGKVLASVLNPYFITEMRHRWWWRGARRLWRDGELFMPGPQAPHYRRRPAHFGRLCSPHFRLTGVFPADPLRGAPFAGLRAANSRYLFLLFEK